MKYSLTIKRKFEYFSLPASTDDIICTNIIKKHIHHSKSNLLCGRLYGIE